ncbi:MAG TPA: cation transporter dimerization domain-containing protein, partial [Myxococcota bacterium]|nr:cation transporter dimerization domain-containing protein [Myxococcota bacterium]
SERTWRFVQVHVELPGDLTLREAHRVADDLEAALCQALPGCDAIVHMDPAGETDAPKNGAGLHQH